MLNLILLFTILFFILAWRRLELAVMVLIITLPAYLIRFKLFGLPLTALEVMIWAVFLVWLAKNYQTILSNWKQVLNKNNKNTKIRYPFDWEIVMMLIIALVAVAAAGFQSSSFGIYKAYFFEPMLFFIVLFNIVKGAKGREKILWSLAVSALLVSCLAFFQKFSGLLIDNPQWAAEETRRVVSFFGYPNAVGLYLGPIVLVLAGWFFSVFARSPIL